MSEFNPNPNQQTVNETIFMNINDAPQKPSNNLPISIVSTVLGLCSPCCIGLIVGIVAIVFSTQVDSKYNTGDYNGAETAAKNAKIFSYIAIALGIIGLIINIVVLASGGMERYMEQYREILGK